MPAHLPRSAMPAARPSRIHLAVLGLLTLPASVLAQQAEATSRVEITGSIIRRSINAETALPVTSITAGELEARGHTELKDFMLELPQANSLGSNQGTAGPMTSLRGLGPMRTLTLLDGRRLPKEPLTNQYTSVNVIPRMALGRTDVLRDGASSSYGSDAIGGVQAFYTLGQFQGGRVKLETTQPEKSGGGATHSLGLIGGLGNLDKQGWNVYAALDVQRRDVLLRADRPELTDRAVLNTLGVLQASPGAATPGNFTDPNNPTSSQRTVLFNPYGSTCLAPYSTPTATGNRCVLDDNVLYTAFNNKNDIENFFAKGSLRLGDHLLTAQFNHSHYSVDQYNAAAAPTVRLTSTHPYYPGNGLVPAVAGLNLAGRPINVQWSVADAGPRIRDDHHYNDRLVLALEGSLAGWDYRGGINHGWSKRETKAGPGWLSVTGLATVQGTATTLFLDPKLNPFGLQTAEGLALLRAASIEGQTLRVHKGENTSVDATFSRELMALSGGPLSLALGAELRRDTWEAEGLASNDVVAALNNQVDILGGDSLAAGANSKTSTKIGRDIGSLFAELDAPLRKDLTLNLSVRADHYKDLKETTVNPKIGLRWQPLPSLVLRGSANTGFRAPSLPELYTRETEYTQLGTFDDPLLCPTVGGVKVPAPGYTAAQVCGLSPNAAGRLWQITKVPGLDLKAETSKSLTFGVVFEPVKNLTMTVDYWKTQIDNVIGNIPIDYMLANPALYASYFRRDPATNLLGVTDASGNKVAAYNVPANQGSLRAAGIDVGLRFTAPKAPWGQVSGGIDIAYLTQWDARASESANWVSALGFYNDVVPVNPNAGLSNATRGLNNRWRHTAQLAWQNADWKLQLSQRYQSAIRDQNLAAATGVGTTGPRDVSSFALYNLSVRYTGFRNLTLNAAVNNLFDTNPPLTNHRSYRGYLTSVADVLGRAYTVSATYSF
ncbi:TonB-dependent receptor domain-containing protein [Pseudaquabacterium pictum]|uniref:TonB-dependent receptor n=1 Tax=Pseudaquabacterium pictum TaxID=2315236 RepID=A0A480AIK3_9BURK|nr:TonB-dependent receptor [Rubrivivax pictus]GCL61569.1 TonB-dependent receptor [Rubrivivax pictus]